MDPQPQQVFLSQMSAKLNSLNPFAQQYFDLFGTGQITRRPMGGPTF